MKRKCECAYQYCCDRCWLSEAKREPCAHDGCKNPRGHAGEHGPLVNTQVIRITVQDLEDMMGGK